MAMKSQKYEPKQNSKGHKIHFIHHQISQQMKSHPVAKSR